MDAKDLQGTLIGISDQLAKLVADASSSVFSVDARRKFPASGYAIDENLILTADHVIEREEKIFVSDGKEKYPATLVGRDPHHDLGLLSVGDLKLIALKPIATDPLVGSLAVALARPGRSIQASLGLLSSISPWPSRIESGKGQAILRAEVSPHPGFSGGPLINMQGDVMGLNTSAIAMGNLVTLSMPYMQSILDQLKKHGHIRQGYMGIRFQVVELGKDRVDALGRAQNAGLLVINIDAGSPADTAKLMVGDILVGLAGEPVNSIESLQSLLINGLAGRKTTAELLRGNTRELVEVEIGER